MKTYVLICAVCALGLLMQSCAGSRSLNPAASAGGKSTEPAASPAKAGGFPQFPAAGQLTVGPRGSSEQKLLLGDQAVSSYNATIKSGGELRLSSTADELSWAVYSFASADEHSGAQWQGLQFSLSQSSGDFWIGYSSFPRAAWVWRHYDSRPVDWTQEVLISASDGLFSPDGTAYCAVLLRGGQTATLSRIKLSNDALGIVNLRGVSPQSAYNVELAWAANDYALSYELFVESPGAAAGSGSLLASLPAGSKGALHGVLGPDDGGTPPAFNAPACDYATDYQYSLRAVASHDGDLIFGPLASVSPLRRELPAPLNVVASQGQSPDSISIFWDAVPEASSYQVFRDGASKSFAMVPACDACEYVEAADTNAVVTDALPHEYRVVALAVSGSSSPSAAASGYTGPVNDYVIDPVLDVGGRLHYQVAADQTPALLAYDKTLAEPVFIQAAETRPDAPADWSWHSLNSSIPQLGEYSDLELNSVSGRFGAILSDSVNGQTWFALSSDSSPQSSADWTLSLLDAGSTAEYCSIADFDGRFIVCYYRPGEGLVVALSANGAPAGPQDWDITLVDPGNSHGLYADMDNESLHIFYMTPDPLSLEPGQLFRIGVGITGTNTISLTFDKQFLTAAPLGPLASDTASAPELPAWDVTYQNSNTHMTQIGWYADGGPAGGGFGPRGSSYIDLRQLYSGTTLVDTSMESGIWAFSYLDSEFGSQLGFLRRMFVQSRPYRVPSGLQIFTATAGGVTTGQLPDYHWFAAYTRSVGAGEMRLHWRYELNLPPDGWS